MTTTGGGVLENRPSPLPFYLVIGVLLSLPFISRGWYGPIAPGVFLTDRAFRDFLFTLIGLSIAGLFIKPTLLRWSWWAVLGCHFIQKQALFTCASGYLTLMLGAFLVLSWLVSALDEKRIRYCFVVITIAAYGNLLFQLLQYAGLDPFHISRDVAFDGKITVIKPYPTGFLGHTTGLGVYYALCLPAVYAIRRWLCVPVMLGAIATGSRICWIILGVYAIILMAQKVKAGKMRLILGTLIGSLSIAATVFLKTASSSILGPTVYYRLAMWRESFAKWEHPFIGNGLGTWLRSEFTIPGPEWFLQAHNEYWQALFELGIIPCVIFAAYAIERLTRLYGAVKWERVGIPLCGLLAISIASLTYFPLHMIPIVTIALIYWAIVEKELA